MMRTLERWLAEVCHHIVRMTQAGYPVVALMRRANKVEAAKKRDAKESNGAARMQRGLVPRDEPRE